MGKLAINGGKNIRKKPWPKKELYNKEQIKKKLSELIDSDNLSGYRGSFGQHFWGGQNVQKLEKFMENYFFEKTGEKTHVLAVNSCTSALQIACGVLDLNRYDEVIVTPWSMTCSATAPLLFGLKPVFADVEKDYFCLDLNSIKEKVTEHTKAIISVDLFGQPHNPEIYAFAKEKGIFVIEDCAQALGASISSEKGIKMTGMLGDIGCFSFTQGKHFTCGEGGLLVTQNEELFMKCALMRNHTEAVINSMPEKQQILYENFKNNFGFNVRMTEMQAIILLEQFFGDGIDREVADRNFQVKKLKHKIQIKGIEWAKLRNETTYHSYYVLPFLFDENILGVTRDIFIEAVKAELRIESTNMGITQKIDPLIWNGYIKPIYQMPIFYNNYDYYNVSLPVVEQLQNETFCFTTFQGLPLLYNDIDDIVDAFHKVYENIEELKD